MSKSLVVKTLLWSVVAILVFALVVVFWFYSSLDNELARSSQVRFTIEKGWGVKIIASELKKQGIISSEFSFIAGAKLHGVDNILHEGEYIIPASASVNTLLSLFSEEMSSLSLSNDERVITIQEGWSNQEIVDYLTENNVVTANGFLDAASSTDTRDLFPDVTFPALSDKPVDKGLEGYLYPDTYRIFKTAEAKDIIFKMLTNFENKLTEDDRNAIAAQGKTLFEVLTLASIVEREESKVDDMKIVAGIFLKRLEIGMPLQSDATINYVTKAGRRQPTLEDLEVDSLYNTYKYQGLPPGPIGNPSLAAIRATIHYEESDYLYFLHPLSGETIYSRTLEQHNANKLKYL
ncbi:MAG: endolytic transglycosylase MltG [Patescibacteria group bacterium]